MLPSFATDTIVRVRPNMVDDGHRNLVPNWDDVATLTIAGCSAQPGATSEDHANRDGVLIHWTVFAPQGADIQPGDAIDYNGARYDVDGQPARWGLGSISYQVLYLTRWEG